MKETIIQNALAVGKVITAIIEKYNLPPEEVVEMAMKIYKENMQYKKNETN